MTRPVHTLLLVILVAGCGPAVNPGDRDHSWQLVPPATNAAPVTAREPQPGQYPAGSRIEDRKAPGGFGRWDNFPLELAGQPLGTAGQVSVVAFPEEPVAYFKHRGFALRVVNRTDGTLGFLACDSMLTLVREARDANGGWRPIELPQEPICGNSFHRVFLEPNQYWEFPAREYAGPLATKLRFRLDPGGDRPAVYSNEFDGRIDPAQFVR